VGYSAVGDVGEYVGTMFDVSATVGNQVEIDGASVGHVLGSSKAIGDPDCIRVGVIEL
jgi:hypothetical protein